MEEKTGNNGPRLKEARHTALALLDSVDVEKPPISINEIYKYTRQNFDLIITGDNGVLDEEVDALTRREEEQVFILYNQNKHSNRQRFSVAHELGHLYMGHVHKDSGIDLESNDFTEKEANAFGAYLLMPPKLLRVDIKSGIRDMKELARLYQVSEIALWWQIRGAGLLGLLK